MPINDAIIKLSAMADLSEEECSRVFNFIMEGKATDSQIGAFIMGLKMKGETIAEITGAARTLKSKAVKINIKISPGDAVLDTCGTGASGRRTFNISTCSAFIVAACGVKVAKHGNRSVTGKCGSADVLEELGVKIDVPPEVMERAMEKINLCFLFAPLYHTSMKYAAKARNDMGVRSIFNILGPLCNPAPVTAQVLGVFDPALTEKMAVVLGKIGIKRAYVVNGGGNFDEVSLWGDTKVSELINGAVKTYSLCSDDFGLKEALENDIKGGSKEINAKVIKDILNGKEEGPSRDIVLANASMALVAAGKTRSFKDGAIMAKEAIKNNKAISILKAFIKITGGGAK